MLVNSKSINRFHIYLYQKNLTLNINYKRSFVFLIIIYYYNPARQLYINLDINKEFDFEIYIYYIKEDLLSKALRSNTFTFK